MIMFSVDFCLIRRPYLTASASNVSSVAGIHRFSRLRLHSGTHVAPAAVIAVLARPFARAARTKAKSIPHRIWSR